MILLRSGLCFFLGALVLNGCTTADVKTQSYLENAVQDAVFRANYLHRLNINDASGLQIELQDWLAIDIRAIWSELKSARLSKEERASALRALRLLAVQSEKYPVAAWSDNEAISAAFEAALAEGPAHAEELRSRNWSKPWWAE